MLQIVVHQTGRCSCGAPATTETGRCLPCETVARLAAMTRHPAGKGR